MSYLLLNLPKKGHGYREVLMRCEPHGVLDSTQKEMKVRCLGEGVQYAVFSVYKTEASHV